MADKYITLKSSNQILGPKVDNIDMKWVNGTARHTWFDVQVYEAWAVDIFQPHRHLQEQIL